MKKLLFATVIAISIHFPMQAQLMSEKYSGLDIDNPKQKGGYLFDNRLQVFTLNGYSYFVSQPVEGDFIISAGLKFTDVATDPGSTIGLMVRGSEYEKTVFARAAIRYDGHFLLAHCNQPDFQIIENEATDIKTPDFVQLERKGNEIIFRAAENGAVPEEIARIPLAPGETALAGMFVCSAQDNIPVTAEFRNVRIEKPATEGTDGYTTPSHSRLEILDVETGLREIIYETRTHIEAPNWSRDGKFLIYNSEGKLYTFDLEKRVPELLYSGNVTANNNRSRYFIRRGNTGHKQRNGSRRQICFGHIYSACERGHTKTDHSRWSFLLARLVARR